MFSKSNYQKYIKDVQEIKDRYQALSRVDIQNYSSEQLVYTSALLGIDSVEVLTDLMPFPK